MSSERYIIAGLHIYFMSYILSKEDAQGLCKLCTEPAANDSVIIAVIKGADFVTPIPTLIERRLLAMVGVLRIIGLIVIHSRKLQLNRKLTYTVLIENANGSFGSLFYCQKTQ